MNPEHDCDLSKKHPEHHHQSMKEFTEHFKTSQHPHHIQGSEQPLKPVAPEVAEEEVILPEPSHRRDD